MSFKLGSTESAKRITGGRLFQHRGPAAENARSPKYTSSSSAHLDQWPAKQQTALPRFSATLLKMARLCSAYVMRHGPFLARLVSAMRRRGENRPHLYLQHIPSNDPIPPVP